MKEKDNYSILRLSNKKCKKFKAKCSYQIEELSSNIETVNNNNPCHKECKEAMKIIDGLLEEKDKLTAVTSQLNKDLLTEKEIVRSLQSELNKLKEKSSSKKTILIKKHSNDNEINNLKVSLNTMTDQYNVLYEENIQLKRSIEEYTVALNNMSNSKTDSNALLKEILRLKKEIEKNRRDFNRHNNNNIEDVLLHTQNENESLKTQIAELKSQKMLLEIRSPKWKQKPLHLRTESSSSEFDNTIQIPLRIKDYTNFFESFFSHEEKIILQSLFIDNNDKYHLFKKKINTLCKAKNSLEQKYKYEVKQLTIKLCELNTQIDYLNNRNKQIELTYKCKDKSNR